MQRQFSGNTRGTPRAEPQLVGPGGLLPAGNAQGEILQWDILLGEWVPVGAPSADGQVLVWDAGTAQWVARMVQTWSLQFASTQVPATAITYLTPGAPGAASTPTQANGQDVVTRAGFLRRLTIMHQVASTGVVLTYTVQVEGANTLLTVSQNGNVAGEVQDAVNVAPIVNLDRVGIRIDNPGPTLTTPRIIGRIEAFAFV